MAGWRSESKTTHAAVLCGIGNFRLKTTLELYENTQHEAHFRDYLSSNCAKQIDFILPKVSSVTDHAICDL